MRKAYKMRTRTSNGSYKDELTRLETANKQILDNLFGRRAREKGNE